MRNIMTHKTPKRANHKLSARRVNLSLSGDLHALLAEEAQSKAVPEATMVKMIIAERYQLVRAASAN